MLEVTVRGASGPKTLISWYSGPAAMMPSCNIASRIIDDSYVYWRAARKI